MPVEVFRWFLLGSSVGLGMMAIAMVMGWRANKGCMPQAFMLPFIIMCILGCPLFLLAGLAVIPVSIPTLAIFPFMLWLGCVRWKHSSMQGAVPHRPAARPVLAWTLIVLLYMVVAAMALVTFMRPSGRAPWIPIAVAAIIVTLVARHLIGLTKTPSEHRRQP